MDSDFQAHKGQEDKIKVAMVIQSYYPHVGGAERQIMSLSPYLHKKGVEITIYTRKRRGLATREMIEGNRVIRIYSPGPKIIAALFYSIGTLLKIQRDKPDIVHAHELLSPTTTAALAKMVLKKPNVVKVLRGGYLGGLYKIRLGKLSSFRIRLIKTYIDHFISISTEIENELVALGIPETKISFIPNGVNTQKFAPVRIDLRPAIVHSLMLPMGKLVFYSGRLVQEKRVENLIHVWPDITLRHPDAFLMILGDGQDRERLEKMASDNIIFLGQVDNVHQYLQAADLFVLPSSTEGLSNAMLEAMSCGLPVIATKIGGAPDVIDHERNGLLIEPDNLLALKNAILQILNSSNRAMGEEARKTILSDYSLEEVANKIYSLYTLIV